MSVIEIPLLNSENFYEVDAITNPLYQTKHFLSDWWMNNLYYWERYNKFYDINNPQYFVKKELQDTVTIQFHLPTSGIDSFTLKMLNCDGTPTEVDGSYLTSTVIAGNTFDDNGTISPVPLTTYQYTFILSDIISDEGYYYFVIGFTPTGFSENQVISEPTWIKTSHENTILIEYSNSVNDYDVAFNTLATQFSKRVDATLKYKPNPKLERTTFRNQQSNQRQLYSRNWRQFEITFGASEGINDVDVDKLSNIFKCDSILIDGKQMLLGEGAEFEATQFSESYPLYTLKLPLEQYFNNNSVAIQPSSKILIMSVGEYPYLVTTLRLSTSYIPVGGTDYLFDSPNGMREVINSSEESDFIDELNAKVAGFGRSGVFEIVDNVLYYKLGSTDSYKSKISEKLDTCLQVWFETNPTYDSLDITLNQNASTGKTAVSVWRDSSGTGGTANMLSADYVPNISGTLFSENYEPSTPSDYDSWRAYVYTNNEATTLEVTTGHVNILALEGSVPTSLETFIARGGALGTFSSDFLRSAASVINSISVQYMGIDSFESDCFTRVRVFDWKYLNQYDLAENDLTNSGQDEFFNKFYAEIASFWLAAYGGAGGLSTVLQSTSSSPTAASATSRNNLIILGYTVAF